MCGESFTRRYNLRGHQRAHKGEKPFACGYPGSVLCVERRSFDSTRCKDIINQTQAKHVSKNYNKCPRRPARQSEESAGTDGGSNIALGAGTSSSSSTATATTGAGVEEEFETSASSFDSLIPSSTCLEQDDPPASASYNDPFAFHQVHHPHHQQQQHLLPQQQHQHQHQHQQTLDHQLDHQLDHSLDHQQQQFQLN
ncbi:hypothetical protein PGTUg99_003380 [Puccinia graminis f. sp. tritici]|uniref:C2H2-type domain-containing protein n=1 Tax=Puccinia graminis f. sp. tritici TaxID=56615 RepID=A0A5B0SH12_PUCGR|nr:hypothetical protein PGTUg99_003380 [Puccinia graminis f. sp. tritici]